MQRTIEHRENQAKGRMEQYYLRNTRNMIYIALEKVQDTDFFWGQREVRKFDRLWKEKTPLVEIAKGMHRSEISVFLLAFDRIARGLIDPRKNWKIW